MKNKASQAASLLGKRSAAARKKKWGAAEFKRRMQEWGKLGGRPREERISHEQRSTAKGSGLKAPR